MLSELGGVSDLSGYNTSSSHDSGVDSAGYTVALLDIDLGHLEVSLVVGVVFLDISL